MVLEELWLLRMDLKVGDGGGEGGGGGVLVPSVVSMTSGWSVSPRRLPIAPIVLSRLESADSAAAAVSAGAAGFLDLDLGMVSGGKSTLESLSEAEGSNSTGVTGFCCPRRGCLAGGNLLLLFRLPERVDFKMADGC